MNISPRTAAAPAACVPLAVATDATGAAAMLYRPRLIIKSLTCALAPEGDGGGLCKHVFMPSNMVISAPANLQSTTVTPIQFH